MIPPKPDLQSMAVFLKILGAPKARIWVRVCKKWSGAPGVPKYLRAALYFCIRLVIM